MGKILALETTEKFGSVALLDGNRLLREMTLPTTDRSAKTVAPALDRLLRDENCEPTDIETVAVVVGPGSFTGLRVGVATAKMFAYAVGATVVAVNTFEVVAAAESGAQIPARFLSVGVDAQRGDVVFQTFELLSNDSEPGGFGGVPPTPPAHLRAVAEPELCSAERWWASANPDSLFTGPALDRFRAKIPSEIQVADEKFWVPKASVAGLIAAQRVAEGAVDDLWSLLPIYSRLSAAEETLTRRTAFGG